MPVAFHNTPLSESQVRSLAAMAARLRRESLISTNQAGSGHLTSCLSCAELVAVLFFRFLHVDVQKPERPDNDRFVLSKGHAAPILWSVLAEAGAFSPGELHRLRTFDSSLEGHPTPRNHWVDVATGSLGQGLSAALGMALTARMERLGNRVWALLGDGETAEGAVWEAAALAGHYQTGHLIAIIDINRLGQSETTMYGHDVANFERRFAAFGWHTQVIDGHEVEAVASAYANATEQTQKPNVILARTIKGKGVSSLENEVGHHGKVLEGTEFRKALADIGEPEIEQSLIVATPDGIYPQTEPRRDLDAIQAPTYETSGKAATRKAYGNALAKLGEVDETVVGLDGEVKNSTHAQRFADAFPERYTECYIAEQNMVGMALGMSVLGKTPFVSSFACFLTRAADQIRMAGISRANVKFCGSHAGISIGPDGPSQMGLEDLALFRAVPESVVLYPADAVCTERVVALAAAHRGIVYLRTTRPDTPVLYRAEDSFEIGGSRQLKHSKNDSATIIAAGITLFEALAAAEELEKQDVQIRVIDAYSVKPLDEKTILQAARETGAVVVVEDHYPQGGLGEAVATLIAGTNTSFRSLAVSRIPRSGDAERLMDEFEISAQHIHTAIEDMIPIQT